MKHQVLDGNIIFTLGDRDGPKRRLLSLNGLTDHQPLLDRMCHSVCFYGYGKANHTQSSYVSNFLSPIASYWRYRNASPPSSSAEWQDFILNFMQFYLCDENWSSASARTRIQCWQSRVAPLFRVLADDCIVPIGVVTPIIRLKNEVSRQPLNEILRSLPRKFSDKNGDINKLIVSTEFSKNDADFLDTIAAECRSKVSILRKICIDHWNAMKLDHKAGQKYASCVSHNEVEELFNPNLEPRKEKAASYKLICSQVRVNSPCWLFAIIKYILANSSDVECISAKSLRGLPFFSSTALKGRDYEKILSRESALNEHAFSVLPTAGYIYHFSGVLSGVDVAAICTLLIIEHPKLNPMSVANARLINVRGKMHLISSDDGQRQIFSVDKPRANSRKSAALTAFSQEVISTVIQLTSPIRRILKKNDDPDWRYLFLGQQVGGRLGRIRTSISDCLTGEKSRSLTRMYPELNSAGLVKGTLSLSKVRNTMGVIKWFDTGSIAEMSRCLGNSKRVALEHYLPPSLLEAWNTRIIRRFQNTLIVLAASEEDYLLDVTDFSSLDDLMQFISQLLFEYKKGTSPVANEVHQLFASDYGGILNQHKEAPNGVINLKLCPTGIAYLYAFHEYAIASIPCDAWDSKSAGAYITPRKLIDIAIFIKHACENDSLSTSLRETLDYESLKSVHFKALSMQAQILERFSRFNLSTRFRESNE